MDATTLRDVMPDRGSSDVTNADRSDAGVVDRPDVASTDRPDVALPEIPTDPMGVPAPGSECTGDAGVRPGDPSIAAPRPILPQSVSRVTSQRPSFRWALPEGTTGARVEVCADRCCTRVIQTLEAEGTTVRPTTALPPGVVYWRMFGRRAGVTGSRASYTWEFGVRRRDTPVDSSWGTIRDFTGDGFDDALLFSGDGTLTFHVVEGGVDGPRAPRVFARVAHPPIYGRSRGDFNGDGRVDIAYRWYVDAFNHRIDVLLSQATGTPRVVQLDVSMIRGADVGGRAVTDWNGDGYSDLVTTVRFFDDAREDILGSVLLVYHGSPTGLSSRPQRVEHFHGLVSRPWVDVLGEVGDVDVDGYGDVAISDRTYFRSGQGTSFLFGHETGVPRAQPALSLGESTDEVLTVLSAGDQDGDGRGEVVVRTVAGSTLRLYRSGSGYTEAASAVREPDGGGGGDTFGEDMSAADLNGDGYADLVVSAPFSPVDVDAGRLISAGRMYAFFGGLDGLSASPIWFGRVVPTTPLPDPFAFASEAASAGDLNGDGIDDVVAIDTRTYGACYLRGAPGLVGARLGDCVVASGGFTGVF